MGVWPEGWLASVGGECTPLTRDKLDYNKESECIAIVGSDAADPHVHGQGEVKGGDSECNPHSCVIQLIIKTVAST